MWGDLGVSLPQLIGRGGDRPHRPHGVGAYVHRKMLCCNNKIIESRRSYQPSSAISGHVTEDIDVLITNFHRVDAAVEAVLSSVLYVHAVTSQLNNKPVGDVSFPSLCGVR